MSKNDNKKKVTKIPEERSLSLAPIVQGLMPHNENDETTITAKKGDDIISLKIHMNSENCQHFEFTTIDTKKASPNEKKQLLKSMEKTGWTRKDMSSASGLSESRESQLIGKKRTPPPETIDVTNK